MKKLIIYILISIFISLNFGAISTYATTPPPYNPTLIPKPDALPGKITPVSKDTTTESVRNTLLTKTLPRIAITIIRFAGVAALIFVIIGGVRFAIAYGDEDSITKGKNQIIYAAAGFVLALLAFTIVTIVANIDL